MGAAGGGRSPAPTARRDVLHQSRPLLCPGVGLGTEAGGSSLPSGKCLSQEGPRHSRKVRTMCRPEGKAREKPLEPTPQPAEARPAQAPGSSPALEAAPQREWEGARPPAHLSPCPQPSVRLEWESQAPAPARAHLSGPLPRRPIGHIPDEAPTRGLRAFVSRHPTASWSAEPDMEAKRQEIRFCIFFLIKRHL